MNATADGVGQVVGHTSLYVYGGWLLKPIDDPSFFVRQQYLDFLGREPDQAGWEFWTGQITQCGADATCIANKRVDVTRAFWYEGEYFNVHPGLRNQPGVTPDFNNGEFVRMCYLTYLRRNPNDPPDYTWDGYNFWLGILNADNDINRLIRDFINSAEYRARFDHPEPEPMVCNPTPEQVGGCELQGSGYYWNYDTCSCGGAY